MRSFANCDGKNCIERYGTSLRRGKSCTREHEALFSNSHRTHALPDNETLPVMDAQQLKTIILEDGLDAATFRTILDREDIHFQDIFGENTLLRIEFDVAHIGEHSHFVFIPHYGADPEIITAYPKDGKLRVTEAYPWEISRHSPERRRQSRQRVEIVELDFSESAWSDMADQAVDINDAGLNYNFILQNSNSVAATLAIAGGFSFQDLKGGGLNLGARNTLFDELAGGWQVPRLLVRGGVSYFGGARIGRIAPEGSDLDTDA